MPTIGLSFPYVAKYETDGAGNVTYSDAVVLARAVEFTTTIEAAADNNFYADNGIAEVDNTFSDGTFELTTDELTQEASALILGITPSTITVGSETVTELIYDNRIAPPYLGFGTVVKKKHRGITKWRAVILTKTQFNIPSQAATTQGETIEWQAPTIDGVILRDDTAFEQWQREATFDTELKARAYIEQILGAPVVTP